MHRCPFQDCNRFYFLRFAGQSEGSAAEGEYVEVSPVGDTLRTPYTRMSANRPTENTRSPTLTARHRSTRTSHRNTFHFL
jgi:hypothetical protein